MTNFELWHCCRKWATYARRYRSHSQSKVNYFVWIESRWSEIFRNRLDRPWGPSSLLYNGHRVSFRGVTGAWRRPPTPHLTSSLKKKYSYTSTPPLGRRGLKCKVHHLGWTLHLPLPFTIICNQCKVHYLSTKLPIFCGSQAVWSHPQRKFFSVVIEATYAPRP
jgi:hypothetical protein